MNSIDNANDSLRQLGFWECVKQPSPYQAPPSSPAPPANSSRTSRAAAESIRDFAPTLRTKVYEAICRAGSHGQTRHEIAAATGIALATVCPRVSELLRFGMVAESGTRQSPAGRAARVLIATSTRKES